MFKRCVIITACLESKIADAVTIGTDDLVICADGGLAFAAAEGVMPDVVIGDFDSLATDPAAVVASIQRDASSNSGSCGGADRTPEIIRLNREKDETDTLACVKYAIAKGISDFLIVGGLGGRFDHSIAIVQTLSFLIDMNCAAWVVDGANRASMISSGKRGAGKIVLEPVHGSCFSVFSFTERSVGVTIANAKYELQDAVLTQSYPIGVSNEFVGDRKPEISVTGGRLLVIISQTALPA